MSTRHPATQAAIAATAVTVAAAAAPTARAAGFGCTASAVKAGVLGLSAEPVRAGSADGCATDAKALEALGAPLAGAASARTGVDGDRAGAATTLTGLKLGSLTALTGQLPQIALPQGIGALPVPLPAAGQLLGLPSLLTVDATQAAQQLVSQRSLPNVAMMAADLVQTGVSAACTAGRPVFDSLANVLGLSALGRALPADRPVDTAVPLVDAQTVDFSMLDLDAVKLPGGLSLANPVTGAILRDALASAVAALPTVSVPAAIGRVVVEPAQRDESAGALHQIGPRVRVEALGRELADVTLGDTLVSALCDAPAVAAAAAPDVSPATELALSCANADVVLTDVVEKDGKVKLVGVAAGRFVGQTIDLVLTHTGKSVAQAVVQPDGYFRARAPLPSNDIRWGNEARYQAVVENERSLALKLHRRMRISRMKPQSGFITITGRIYGDRANDPVVISRKESCTKDVQVTTVKPGRDGRWRVTLPVPEGLEAATYRATTQVRRGDNPKRFRTFTLPGHVAL
jgi:hypothetical protein